MSPDRNPIASPATIEAHSGGGRSATGSGAQRDAELLRQRLGNFPILGVIGSELVGNLFHLARCRRSAPGTGSSLEDRTLSERENEEECPTSR